MDAEEDIKVTTSVNYLTDILEMLKLQYCYFQI